MSNFKKGKVHLLLSLLIGCSMIILIMIISNISLETFADKQEHLVCNKDIRYNLSELSCQFKTLFPRSKQLTLFVTYHNHNSYLEIKHLLNDPIYKLVRIPQNRYDEAIIYTNPINQHLNFESEYTGMLLYSFIKKGLYRDYIDIINKTYYEYDVYALRWDSTMNIFQDIDKHHGNHALHLLKLVITKLGFNPDNYNDTFPIWTNSWFGKSDVFKQYIVFLENVFELLETDPECSQYVNMNSRYGRQYSKKKLERIYKQPYMTLHAFILERMLAVFFRTYKFKVMYVE